MPVAFDSLFATTACTLAIGRSIVSGECEPIANPDCATDEAGMQDEDHFAIQAAQ